VRPALLTAALLLTGCDEGGFARVARIDAYAQTIGGPAAAGAPGDFLLENDRIRVIVHARPEHTASTVAFGGTIVDVDLQRTQPRFSEGRGLDQFFELGPLVNLRVPRPEGADGFSVLHAEASEAPDGAASLRVEGGPGNVIEAVGMLDRVLRNRLAGDPAEDPLRLSTTYELRPGEPFVRITAEAWPSGPVAGVEPLPMEGFSGSKSLLEILFGDVEPVCDNHDDCPAEDETCRDALPIGGLRACRSDDSDALGAFGGWLALLGAKLKTFVPGPGFDPWLNLKTAIAQELDVFSRPVPFDVLAGVGDRVSYALFSGEGTLLVPVASSNFTIAISNAVHCRDAEPDCLAGEGIRLTGYLSVGEGDVASALAPYYEVRGISTGRLDGVVVAQRTGRPEPHVDVFVLSDPWPDEADAIVAGRSYAELVAAGRARTRSDVRPAGDAGVVSHLRSDVGTDPRLDGDFSGAVPAAEGGTRYLLVPRRGDVVGAPHPVRVRPGRTTEVVVVLPEAGRLEFEVRGESSLPVPAKLTLGQCLPECARDADCPSEDRICDTETRRCVPAVGCTDDGGCDPDEWCDAGACRCRRDGVLPRELGGGWWTDGTVLTTFTGPWAEEVTVPPGTYEAVFSRGFEYTVDRRFVRVEPSRTTRVVAHLDRVVDTEGWISADFHVHGANSPDSGMPLFDRALTYAAEGVELLSSSDHDVFTDYGPVVYEGGLSRWLATQVGVETSPIMLSHFVGFPMTYDENRPQNMPERVAFDWHGRRPAEIMADMRAAGALGGGGDALVVIPHVFDYFNYFGLDPYDLSVSPNLLMALADPLFAADNFSGAFDGFEVANGKNLDYLRRPTVGEVRDYNAELAALTAKLKAGAIDLEEYSRRHIALGRRAIGRILARTPAEQAAFFEAEEGADCGCLGTAACEPTDAPDDAPCKGFYGVVDDWFRMLGHGVFRVALANSDSHDPYGNEAGLPRNWVRSESDWPLTVDPVAIDHAVRRREVLASYGPFVRFTVDGHGPGGTVVVDPGQPVELSVSVQSPLWFDVDRVEVYRSGALVVVFPGYDEAPDDPDCITVPNDTVLNLDVRFQDDPPADAWYVVAAVGARGKDLAPVYSSSPLPRFGLTESMSALFEVLPLGSAPGAPRSPSVHSTLPWALTNPVVVDVGGDGLSPPEGPPPGWAER